LIIEYSSETEPADGMLVGCHDAPFSGRVYYVSKGSRRWLPGQQYLTAYGLSIGSVVWLSPEEIRRYPLCGPVPLLWPSEARRNPPRSTPSELREIAVSTLSGRGLEFGAFANPFPVPKECQVEYADRFTSEELFLKRYPGQSIDIVPVSHVTSLDSFQGVRPGEFDFVIASHVIEHTRNPIGAIEKAYSALKPGGELVLVVPDKRLTFDRDRDITELSHLIDDYIAPHPDRDVLHYVEFYARAFVTQVEALYSRVKTASKRPVTFTFIPGLTTVSGRWSLTSASMSCPGRRFGLIRQRSLRRRMSSTMS
jgi:SAM-dependent methyltransferase